jgi:gentisate 1,2-dioxygenase
VTDRTDRLAQRDLWGELIALRDAQRLNREKAVRVVRRGELPLELNPHGRMRWYLHPTVEDTAHQAVLFYSQELQPGESSGRQRHPGGLIIVFVRGQGYTTLNGERHDWVAGDLLQVPILPDGSVLQHQNTSDTEYAELVACELNESYRLGVDRGAVFEEEEPAASFVQQAEST